MAVSWKLENQPTRDSEYAFDPADIFIEPSLNGRHDAPDIEWLIESILEDGQLQPVGMRSDGGVPVLIFGMSRYRAIVEINNRRLTPRPLKIKAVYSRTDARLGFCLNIVENHHRNETTDLDDAYNCLQLEQWGYSRLEIAKVYREGESWVRDRLALVEAAPEVKEALKSKRVSAANAVKLAKLSAGKQRDAVAGDGKIKTSDVLRASGKKETWTLKQVREHLELHADDTTANAQFRKLCGELLCKMGAR